MTRDIEKNPYTHDEARVAAWIADKTGIGGGDDPIGFMLASFEMIKIEVNLLHELYNIHALVPREPTEEMIAAGLAATNARLEIPGSAATVNREKMRRRYKAMVNQHATRPENTDANPGVARISYDERADVLYVNYMPGVPAYSGVEDEKGVIRRRTKNGELVGVTLVDFADRLKNHSCLTEE